MKVNILKVRTPIDVDFEIDEVKYGSRTFYLKEPMRLNFDSNWAVPNGGVCKDVAGKLDFRGFGDNFREALEDWARRFSDEFERVEKLRSSKKAVPARQKEFLALIRDIADVGRDDVLQTESRTVVIKLEQKKTATVAVEVSDLKKNGEWLTDSAAKKAQEVASDLFASGEVDLRLHGRSCPVSIFTECVLSSSLGEFRPDVRLRRTGDGSGYKVLETEE